MEKGIKWSNATGWPSGSSSTTPPQHGSWLNIAENELSALTTQCLSRRIGTLAELQHEVRAWEQSRNEARVRVNWRFTIDRAREKLHRVYPQV